MKTIIHKILYPESLTDYVVGNKKLLAFIVHMNVN